MLTGLQSSMFTGQALYSSVVDVANMEILASHLQLPASYRSETTSSYNHNKMFFSLSFVAALRLAVLPAVLSASIAANLPERRAAEPKTITINGLEIHVATVPVVAPSQFNTTGSDVTARSSSGTSLTKRTTNDACFYGCSITCTNSLGPTAPTSGDCSALASAVNALALSELGPYPCSFNNPSCTNFVVAPGWEQQYTYGTCLVGFANLNPSTGPNLSYCDYLVGGSMPSIFSNCVTTAGDTGGYCYQSSTGYLYAIEVRHS